jgi:hypothetical protein
MVTGLLEHILGQRGAQRAGNVGAERAHLLRDAVVRAPDPGLLGQSFRRFHVCPSPFVVFTVMAGLVPAIPAGKVEPFRIEITGTSPVMTREGRSGSTNNDPGC